MTPLRSLALACLLASSAGCMPRAADPGPSGPAAPRDATEWPSYGGDAGGTRFARGAALTPANVAGLEVAWTYHTRDLEGAGATARARRSRTRRSSSTARSSSARRSTG